MEIRSTKEFSEKLKGINSPEDKEVLKTAINELSYYKSLKDLINDSSLEYEDVYVKQFKNHHIFYSIIEELETQKILLLDFNNIDKSAELESLSKHHQSNKNKQSDVKISKRIACQHCGGSGYSFNKGSGICPDCHGSGQINGKICHSCGGKGSTEIKKNRICMYCGGAGLTESEFKKGKKFNDNSGCVVTLLILIMLTIASCLIK